MVQIVILLWWNAYFLEEGKDFPLNQINYNLLSFIIYQRVPPGITKQAFFWPHLGKLYSGHIEENEKLISLNNVMSTFDLIIPSWATPHVQFSSVTQLCLTLCNPMNRNMLGLPIHHCLLEFTQTHVHWVFDAIQPSHPLSSPSPPAPNPSQHQSIFQWVNYLFHLK